MCSGTSMPAKQQLRVLRRDSWTCCSQPPNAQKHLTCE
jgi:hypothetical protein